MNLTIYKLFASNLLQRTPYISLSQSYRYSNFQISSSVFSHSIHTFLFSLDPQITLNSSKFSFFLRSPIYVREAETYETVTHSSLTMTSVEDNAITSISVKKHFRVVNSIFFNNSNTYIGGCIFYIGTNPDLTVTVDQCDFMYNNATFGGAVYFHAQGTIDITDTAFIYNYAKKASHLYLSGPIISIKNSNLSKSLGKLSGIVQTVSGSVSPSITLEGSSLYKNSGQFQVRDGPLTINSCSLFFPDDAKSDTTFFILESTNEGSEVSITITNSCLNLSYFESINTNPTPPLDGKEDSKCLLYQVIPTPSITLNPKMSDLNSIVSILTPFFCFLLSIFGIIFVSCHCLKPIPPSESSADELIEDSEFDNEA